MRTFDDLLAEAAAAPVDGWGFSWLEGRATEERPSWGYARQLVRRLAAATAVLDIQTGGGEVLAEVLSQLERRPPVIAATEGWAPNLVRATRILAPYGAQVVERADTADLPFPASGFDLVVSRHPTLTLWPEVARVLEPGGTYFSQQVGVGSNHELRQFLMGPHPIGQGKDPRRAVASAQAAGLDLVDLREETLTARYFDIGAVVYVLRKVVWTVPDFTIERYRDRLRRLHERIEAEGFFETSVPRYLIEVRKGD